MFALDYASTNPITRRVSLIRVPQNGTAAASGATPVGEVCLASENPEFRLYASYLDTLPDGDYTFRVTTAEIDGDPLYFPACQSQAAFTIARAPVAAQALASPATGDSANMGLWLALLVIAGAGLVMAARKRQTQ